MVAYDQRIPHYFGMLFLMLFVSMFCEAHSGGTLTYKAKAKDNQRTEAFIKRIGLGHGVISLLDDASFILEFSPELAVFYFSGDLDEHEALHITSFTKVSRDVTWWKDRQAAYRFMESTVFVPDDHLLTYKYNSEENVEWQITGEQKEINGYICFRALGEDINYSSRGDSIFRTAVEAWYCPDLPYPYGPEKYGGLPGMILKLDNGLLVYESVSIVLDRQPEIPARPQAVEIHHVTFLRQFNQGLDGLLKKIKAREDEES